MSQIKYLAYAFLLLLFFTTAAVVVYKLSSVELVAQKRPAIDYVDKTAIATVSINAEGKHLFAENCAVCHPLDKWIEGPNLQTVETRGPWVERKNLITWIKNPAMTIPKFQYTKDLVTQFNGLIMPSFSNLTDAQIETILDYIKGYPLCSNGIPTAMQ